MITIELTFSVTFLIPHFNISGLSSSHTQEEYWTALSIVEEFFNNRPGGQPLTRTTNESDTDSYGDNNRQLITSHNYTRNLFSYSSH